MPKILITSLDALYGPVHGSLNQDSIQALKKVTEAGNLVVVISSGAKPSWFNTLCPFAQFIPTNLTDRQNGNFIHGLIANNKALNLQYGDVVILAAKKADALLSFNAKVVMLRADWTHTLESRMRQYGVAVSDPHLLPGIIDLLNDEAPWFFSSTNSGNTVYALTNAGTNMETDAKLQRLAFRLRACLKNGESKHKEAFRLHLLSSICATPALRDAKVFGFFPSSDSKNNGEEVIAPFAELVRTTFGSRICKSSQPLFVRHIQSIKRCAGGCNRTDPSNQITTIHLNPIYKPQISGKHVVVIDDYLTYGCSFGVAIALLKKAGAAKVSCIALGKFGNQARQYQIEFASSAFQPINTFKVRSIQTLSGTTSTAAKLSFVKKFRDIN